jgi:type I restriction enzyme S subunit
MKGNLGDFVEVISGFAFKSELFSNDIGVPLIRIRDVLRGYSETFYTGEFVDKYLIKQGDILIGMDGEFNSAEWSGVDSLLNQRVCKIVPDQQKLDSRYLLHFLPKRLKAIEDVTSFVTVKHLSVKDIKGIEINLPSIKEQKRIAAILDKADNLRRKREQAIKLADDFLRSTFLDMFGDPVVNSKKWPERKISEFSVITTGNTPSRDVEANFGSTIEWIKSDNINTPSHFLTPASEHLSEIGVAIGRTVPSGSTLMTCIAGSPSCIGNVAMADRKVAFNQQINAMTPNSDVEPAFLYCLMLFSKKRIQASSTNSMKGMISKGVMEQIKLIWPPKHLQEKFTENFKIVLALSDRMKQFDADLLCSSLQSEYLA